MGFILRWTDRNMAEDGYRVYRSTSPMDPQNMPAPVVDLAIDVEEYEDMDVTQGVTYYYRVGAYVGTVEKLSKEFQVVADDSSPVINKVNFYYTMENLTVTDVVDDTGKYNAIIKGSPLQVAVENSYALDFNGAGDYLAIRGLFKDGTYTVLSAGCWFKTASNRDQILISFDRSEFYRLEIGGDSGGTESGILGVSVMTETALIDYGGITRVDDDEWHLAIFTFDNGELTLYLDGRIENQYTFGTTIGPAPLAEPRYGAIGVGSEMIVEDGEATPLNYFEGLLTKVFEMERVITPEEVLLMYKRGVDA